MVSTTPRRFSVRDVPELEDDLKQDEGCPAAMLQLKAGGGKDRKTSYLTVGSAGAIFGSKLVDSNQITVTSIASSGNLALYEEELRSRPHIAQLLSSLVPGRDEVVAPNTAPNMTADKKGHKKANLGTIMGVYLPTVQNILGVLLFLRLPWIVGMAGVGLAFLLVSLCCTATMLTAISLSAIATNGRVQAGGSYFMISRNLGPEFGGAVGVLFYLANVFSASLYVVGGVEILVTYVVPQASLFGEVHGNPNVLFNNVRVYGTILLLLLSLIVFVGVKIVNWFATVSLVVVVVAVVSIYAGALNPVPRVPVCTVDGVILKGPLSCDAALIDPDFARELLENDSAVINKVCSEFNPELRRAFNSTFFILNPGNINKTVDTPDAGIWTQEPECINGIPGITQTITITENAKPHYLRNGDVQPGVKAVSPPDGSVSPQVTATLTTSFLVLIGIFFPSVTGIMSGSNRSGDLKDAQKSIPLGTLAAISTTTTIYLTCVLFFGGTIRRLLLVDQYGNAEGLTVSLLAWPSRYVILVGALFTLGASLQTLTGAPRLLQAIANDNLISFLNFFKRTGLNGEPSFALALSVCLSEVGVLIASLDTVAHILSMFFLICYMFVNFACTLQSILKVPNWRPRFKYYHWVSSLIGALLCLVLMFLVNWYFALLALILAAVIYKYIEYHGAEKEWGDGVRGLSLQTARYALLKLEDGPLHTKNWCPQILLLCKLDSNLLPEQPKLLSFASQLKAGKGLTMVHSVLEGKYTEMAAESTAAKQTLKSFLEDYKIKGFVQVVATTNVIEGLSSSIQSAGLGGMQHNTVVICWPDKWREKESCKLFIECIRVSSSKELAVLVPKGIDWYPSNEDRMKGNIDIWWVVHDGGLLMLLPFLLCQHKVWRQCHLRIFTVAQLEDNSIQMKKDLVAFLYQLRISAEVDVIEMSDTCISAYTYERTLLMEQRNQMLRRLKMKKGLVQRILSKSFSSKTVPLSSPTEISIALPPTLRPNTQAITHANVTSNEIKVSIGELLVEPRVVGIQPISHTILTPTAEQQENSPTHTGPTHTGPSLSGSNTVVTSHPKIAKRDGEPGEQMRLLEGGAGGGAPTTHVTSADSLVNQPNEENLLRMNTSVKLNELIVTRSQSASLVIVNLPAPPSNPTSEENYMEFLDVLTEGLERVLMVRGGGREVITIYS